VLIMWSRIALFHKNLQQKKD